MLGFYDYTVIMTYISLTSSIVGMMVGSQGRFKMAVFCLALSGFCDMFDGKIARTKKNRTEAQKKFGIQLDSLCDVVCFGAFPALLSYWIGVNSWHGRIILVLYAICGVIRLAYFNVMEEIRQNETSENRKVYQGLPITSISVILPIAYLLRPVLRSSFQGVLEGVMGITGLLFITDFAVKKPDNRTLAVLVAVVGLAILKIMRVF